MKKKKLYVFEDIPSPDRMCDLELDIGHDKDNLVELGAGFEAYMEMSLWSCLQLFPNRQNIILRNPKNEGLQIETNLAPSDIGGFVDIINLNNLQRFKRTIPVHSNYLRVLINYEDNKGIYEVTFKGLEEHFDIERV